MENILNKVIEIEDYEGNTIFNTNKELIRIQADN